MSENKLKLLKELLESFKSEREVYEPFVMSFEDETDDALEWAIEQAERVQKLEEIKSDAIKQIDVTQRRNERSEERVQELEGEIMVYESENRSLAKEREALRQQVQELEGELTYYKMATESYLDMEQQNKRYREALIFYAKRNHYHAEGYPDTRLITNDYGEVAREALEEPK